MGNQGSALEEAKEQLLQRQAEKRVNRGTRSAEQLLSGLILFDVLLIGIPVLMLIPLFRLAHLPLEIDIVGMAVAFYGGTGVSGVFSAIMLLLITFPPRQTVAPILARFRKKRPALFWRP